MKIGGLQKFSLIDYPGKITAIIFTQGCNFNCFFCHNQELIPLENEDQSYYSEDKIIEFLKNRKNKLEAVSITGGEPLLQADIENFIKKIKDLGFLVKLDTNGSSPQKLEKIINAKIVDYLAMDIKSPLIRYEEIIQKKTNLENIEKSIKLIIESGLDYEFRTTYPDRLLNEKDILAISELIKGAQKYYFQKITSPEKKDYFEKMETLVAKLKPTLQKNIKEIFIR